MSIITLLTDFGLNDYISKGGISTEISDDKKNIYEIVVGIKKHKNIYSLKGLLVHELSHAVTQLMKRFNFNCDEFRSYTLQWLYQEFIPTLDNILTRND